MSMYDAFKIYRDRFGLNQLDTDGSTGRVSQNGSLFTMEYIIHLMNDKDTPEDVKQQELSRIREAFYSLEVFPGVSTRYPGDKEFDSMDNTGAMYAFSGLYDDGKFSQRAFEHGCNVRATSISSSQDKDNSFKYYPLAWILSGFKSPRFFWNNNNPSEFCFFGWHGRSPAHLAFIKMTAGQSVNVLEQLYIVVGQFLGCFQPKDDLDARKLSYINWQYLKKRNFMWRYLYKLWCFILLKQYPNGMMDVYSKYYRDPNHPIKCYSVKAIE